MGKTAKYTDEQLADLELRVAQRTAQAIEDASHETTQAGKGWYYVAREWAKIVGEAAGYTGTEAVDRGAMAIGVLSPRVRWAQNVNDAIAIASDNFDWTPSAFGTNVRKAVVVLAPDVSLEECEEEIGGKKVTAFVDNIRRPAHSQAVVVDTHMCKLFGIPGRDIELKGVYEAVVRGVQYCASVYKLRPSQAQAIAWIETRGPDKEDIIG